MREVGNEREVVSRLTNRCTLACGFFCAHDRRLALVARQANPDQIRASER